MRRLIVAVLAPAVALPAWASAEPINLTMLSNYSRATFKSDAPLETIVGTTAGPAVTGSLTVDPLKSIDIEGPLEPGKEVLAKVRGILTIKQKPFETVADARGPISGSRPRRSRLRNGLALPARMSRRGSDSARPSATTASRYRN